MLYATRVDDILRRVSHHFESARMYESPIVILLGQLISLKSPINGDGAHPKLASCQLMKHSVAVLMFNCETGERYNAPTIARTCRADLLVVYLSCRIMSELTNEEDPIGYIRELEY